ncbi:hypothetical protein chiPu_0023470, partial [Chiloscyllium punctatum]|nr:hypothetical protein [Chiloscyllium punctatum]
ELETQRTVGGDGSKVQRGEAMLVRLVDVGTGVHQLVGNRVLSSVTGDVEGSVPVGVRLIDLREATADRSACPSSLHLRRFPGSGWCAPGRGGEVGLRPLQHHRHPTGSAAWKRRQYLTGLFVGGGKCSYYKAPVPGGERALFGVTASRITQERESL